MAKLELIYNEERSTGGYPEARVVCSVAAYVAVLAHPDGLGGRPILIVDASARHREAEHEGLKDEEGNPRVTRLAETTVHFPTTRLVAPRFAVEFADRWFASAPERVQKRAAQEIADEAALAKEGHANG
jgi:hypothetical protein